MPKYDGPWKIIKTFPEKLEYTLELPNSSNIFPSIHASQLCHWVVNYAIFNLIVLFFFSSGNLLNLDQSSSQMVQRSGMWIVFLMRRKLDGESNIWWPSKNENQNIILGFQG